MHLQDTIYNSAEFLRLLQYTRGTFDMRVARGEIAFAHAAPINAHINEYLAADAPSILTSSMLSSRGLSLKIAAQAVRTDDGELWLGLVSDVEDDPRTGKETLPADQQTFLAVALTDDGAPIVEGGLRGEVLAKLATQVAGPNLNFFGVSIQGVLRQIRTNGRLYKVDLPSRFTTPTGAPDYLAWRSEIAAYRRAAEIRFKAKNKARQAKIGERAAETRTPA